MLPLLRKSRLSSRLTCVRWSKLDAERVQSLEGILYDLLFILSVGWSFPESAGGVARVAGQRLELG